MNVRDIGDNPVPRIARISWQCRYIVVAISSHNPPFQVFFWQKVRIPSTMVELGGITSDGESWVVSWIRSLATRSRRGGREELEHLAQGGQWQMVVAWILVRFQSNRWTGELWLSLKRAFSLLRDVPAILGRLLL